MNTKEKILAVSLELFSEKGFSAVSVRDIAAAVGVRESAMYKHFASKQAVFDRLVTDYLARSDEFMGGIHALPTDDPAVLSQVAAIYKNLSDEDFLRMGGSVFTDFLMQPDVLQFWRMISIERFHDKDLAKLWNHHLFETPIAFQTKLFGALIEAGALKLVDPSILALEFYTPLLLLYLQALPFETDGPEFKLAVELASQHMKHFREIYAVKEEN